MTNLRKLICLALLAGLPLLMVAQEPSAAVQAKLPDSVGLVAIKTVQPAYPQMAEGQAMQRRVTVRLQVAESGEVEAVEVVSGDALLAEAVVAACREWQFKAFIKDGLPIKIATRVTYEFLPADKSVKLVQTAPTAANTAAPLRVLQAAAELQLARKVTPQYPPIARDGRIMGDVVLRAVISKEGVITDLRLITGHPMLAPAAIKAVRQWQYKPYLLNGEPVEVETLITVRFQLGR